MRGRRGRAGPAIDGSESDADLLAAAEWDTRAFGVLYDRHAPDLHRWFAGQGAPPDDAADLLAELFAQVWLSRRRFRDEGDGNARPWMFGIARNLLGAYRRRHRVADAARQKLGMRVDIGSSMVDDDVVVARLDADSVAPHIRAGLEALPVGQREAIGLRVVGGLPYAEVAEALGCTDVTARKRVSNGLKSLRNSMEEQQ